MTDDHPEARFPPAEVRDGDGKGEGGVIIYGL
jgi:hypothetical protein